MLEVFGYPVDMLDGSTQASRRQRWCPFLLGTCRKQVKSEVVGTCSISDGNSRAIICPERFRADDMIFKDAARALWGPDVTFHVRAQVPFMSQPESQKAVGNLDFVIARTYDSNPDGAVQDFAVVETQAVYFSGSELTSPFRAFIEGRQVSDPGRRHPDYRSSATKRLMPQLRIKVRTLRAWGAKMFVVVDAGFFNWMPPFAKQGDISNSEVTWLVYDLVREGGNAPLHLEARAPQYSSLDDAVSSLTAGAAQPRSEFLQVLQERLARTDTATLCT